MPSQITTRCSSCESAFQVDDSCFGENVRCPNCDDVFVVSVIGLGSPAKTPVPTREWSARDGTVMQIPEMFAEAKTQRTRPATPKSATQSSDQIGRFEVRETLGSGGFGVVYLAHDPLLDRKVALKVPHVQQSDERANQRFTTEAKSAARLKHPGIVAVLEAGSENGHSWIASEYVNGMTMADRLKVARPNSQLAAVWIRDLADALAYAHSEGIVHRDIKPDNIILNQNDRPQIMDFGLAKQIADDAGITRDGSIIGTPAYMSPEQARAEGDAVGPRSDQYSLAAVMYELLTGQKPFDGPAHYVIAQVATAEPPRPSVIDRSIPKDLEAICLHGLEKDAACRYPNLEIMSEDLDSWLNGRETVARPLRVHEYLFRWIKKSPAVASLSLAVALCLIVGFIAVSWQWRRAERNLTYANTQRKLAEENQLKFQQQRDKARTFAAEADKQRNLVIEKHKETQKALALAQAKTEEAAIQTARAKTNKEKADIASKRADQSAADAQQQRMAAKKLKAKDFLEMGYKFAEQQKYGPAILAWAQSIATLPDEDDEYSHVLRSNLAIYGLQLNQMLGVLDHDDSVTCCAIESQGRFILTGSKDKKARLWNAVNGELLFEPIAHDDEVTAVAFSPTGSRFVICSGNQAKLWDLESGEVVGKPWSHPDIILSVAFSQDGSRVITGCADRMARVWNPSKGRNLTAPMKHDGQVHAVALSPDGKLAITATAGISKKLTLWNSLNGKPLALLAETKEAIRAVAVSRDGKWFATGCDDSTARIWNARTGQPAHKPLIHRGPVNCVAFAQDDSVLITGSADKTIRLWNVETGASRGESMNHSGAVTCVAYDKVSEVIAAGGSDGALQLWQPPGANSGSKPIPHELVRVANFNSDGSFLATAGEDRCLRLWNSETLEPIGQPMRHPDAVSLLSISGDSKTIATGSGGAASLWNVDSQIRNVPRLKHLKEITAVAISPDGRITATAGADSVARLWDTESGVSIGQPFEHDSVVVAMTFSSDGSLLATASRDTLHVWKVSSGESACEPVSQSGAKLVLTFSPVGDILAFAGSDHMIRLLDVDSGKVTDRRMRHGGAVHSIEFSSDGRMIVSASEDHRAALWHVQAADGPAPLLRHSAPVNDAEFLPGNRTVVTACSDGLVRMWDTVSGRLIGIPLKHKSAVTSISVDSSGQHMIAVCDDKSAHLWNISRPVDVPRDAILMWAEVVTGMSLNDDGQVRVLPLNEWNKLQNDLEEMRQSSLKKQK